MGITFWIQRFLLTWAVAGSIVGTVHLAKGHSIEDSVRFGLAWGLISAAIFVAGRVYRSRRGQHCSMCQDTPRMGQSG